MTNKPKNLFIKIFYNNLLERAQNNKCFSIKLSEMNKVNVSKGLKSMNLCQIIDLK